ncbi:type IV conjugative transfer system protein TraL [Shewanella colwelliana]|uniref:type IV conjugative transfer system protein TraL n=1 Tax=Shewanella colwelliana TaxID=23 RepID=UPI0037351976
MDNPTQFFNIPKRLNNTVTLLGFAVDELAPALCCFGVLFMMNHALTGMALAAVWFIGLRRLKSQYGMSVLRLTAYWYAPTEFSQSFLKRTPAACRRYWLR